MSQGPLQAVWIGPTLVLARRVRVEEGTFLQGCWLDWDVDPPRPGGAVPTTSCPTPAWNRSSRRARLAPTRMLASLPVRLVPGSTADEPEPRWSPVRLSLLIAWACLALAAVAVALVLRGALALSERRGTFVSAVTHELRTPLTTFRLYTEMLDEGMVAERRFPAGVLEDAPRRGRPARPSGRKRPVLRQAGARPRGRRPRGRRAGRAARPPGPSATLRARQAGMELIVGPVDSQANVRVDLSVVDQILSNLVDNAVKYAGSAADRRIHLDVAPAGRWLALTVRDHGPGLHPKVIRRLFRPFSKSAHDAAQSAPGVGLGLALSRRLARALGGDLRLHENGSHGAASRSRFPGRRAVKSRRCEVALPSGSLSRGRRLG